jgi:hypothetical protein
MLLLRLLLLALLTGLSARAARAQSDTAWDKLYLRDLDSLYQAIAANHPGAIDEQNPAFARTLQQAYEEARKLSSKVKDFPSFRIGLQKFIDQFEDEHLQIGFQQNVDSLREAGIIVKYDGSDFVIVDVHNRYGNASRLIGAKILMCDGVPAAAVFQKRVLWWRGRESIRADWYRQAPYFFVDFGPPTPRAPRSCMFDALGTRMIQQLQWRTTPTAAFNAALRQTFPVVARQLGTERVGGKALWVQLPTFAANADTTLTAMRSTLDSLRTFLQTQPDWSLLVFDLRNNSGGSSSWGDEIAKIIFGAEWLAQASAHLFDGVYTEWRLSSDNLRAMRGLQQQIARRDGEDSESARGFREFVDSAEAAFRRGDKFYSTPRAKSNVPPPAAVSVPGKIVVITTPSCFSACLDFLDRMRLHPSVVQVGQTTGVDTNYMENTGGSISTLTRWSYPMKVYRNRKRTMNQAYSPKIVYEASTAEDQALRDWVLENYQNW